MNFPSQSRMMNPLTAPCDDLDPSKLILMNPPHGFFHATQYVFFRLVVEIIGFGSWIECVRLCLMRHSAVAFLALINVIPRLGVSLRNTILFLVFYILYSRATNLFILTVGPAALALLSICSIPICGSKWGVMLSQLWETTNLQQSCKTVHPKNKWVISSVVVWQKGQRESMSMPLWAKVPLVSSDAWQICQRKFFNFGITSKFQIHLYSRTGGLTRSSPCAVQVADLVENWPFLESPNT